jgi:hypothetical protein
VDSQFQPICFAFQYCGWLIFPTNVLYWLLIIPLTMNEIINGFGANDLILVYQYRFSFINFCCDGVDVGIQHPCILFISVCTPFSDIPSGRMPQMLE